MNCNGTEIELLAPVGGREQLDAALRCGADAVYFGMSDFNARRNADNFADSQLAEVIAECHVRGVKVNITLNTLIADDELDAMRRAADLCCSAGADAVITQDFAAADYIHKAWPQVELHASTQMAVHNAEGARLLTDLGFRRIVLARELSLKEIAAITAATDAACEVFVHGAHCMSVSGNCYLSAMIGGRSGNRGLCAQPCRLDWQCDRRSYVLSLKDLSYIGSLPALAEAGVVSLKIEGRMKRAEYVAAAVTACRDAAAGIPPDMETLKAVFSRSGFTDGFLTGKRTTEMFGTRTKEDVTAAAPVFSRLQQLYCNEKARVPVSFDLTVKADAPALLHVRDGQITVTAQGTLPQPALNRVLTPEEAAQRLAKTGGTPFYARDVQCSIDEGLMLSAAELNNLRREGLSQLAQARGRLPEREKQNYVSPAADRKTKSAAPAIVMRFEKYSQVFSDCPAHRLILPVAELAAHPEAVAGYGGRLIGEIPALLWEGRGEKLKPLLMQLNKDGVTEFLCNNIGAVEICRSLNLKFRCGHNCNITNGVSAARYADLGAQALTLSFELSFERVRSFAAGVPTGIITYGFVPLMKFRNCPLRKPEGCGTCPGAGALTDRMKERYTVLCRERQYSELLNCVPIYVADKALPPVDFEELYFTTETREECARVWALYSQKAAPDFRRTAGLYARKLL